MIIRMFTIEHEFQLHLTKLKVLIVDLQVTFVSTSRGGSPGPVQPICAQRWHKARFISFHLHVTSGQESRDNILIVYYRLLRRYASS